MIHDPNAETSEIPMDAVREQLRILAERSRRDAEGLAATLLLPVVPDGPISHRRPRRQRTGVSPSTAALVLATAMLVGGGVAVRIAATAKQVPIAIQAAPSPVRPTPSAAPRRPGHRSTFAPAPMATDTGTPQLALAAVPAPTRVPVTHRVVPTRTRPSAPPSSPSPSPTAAAPGPVPTLASPSAVTPSPIPSLTPSESPVPIPTPTLPIPTDTPSPIPTIVITLWPKSGL